MNSATTIAGILPASSVPSSGEGVVVSKAALVKRVSKAALVKRINRRLAHDFQRIAYGRSPYGSGYEYIFTDCGAVTGGVADLEDYARELGVFGGHEGLAVG